MTYAHDGDILENNDSTSRDTSKSWNNLKAAAYYIRWMNKFWMTVATFNDLFALVQPHMQDYWVNHDGLRSYSKRHRLLLILSFLAHVPTIDIATR